MFSPRTTGVLVRSGFASLLCLGKMGSRIEVTGELMKAVVDWEGKLNNFFLKSLDIWKKHSRPEATAGQEIGIADQQLLSALDKTKTDVDAALCDSFNTTAVMRIRSGLVPESNSAEELSDQTIISLAQWVTCIVTIFGLDPEGDLNNPDRIGWSGLNIPAPAKPYVYPASQLRSKVRTLVCSGSIDHAAIAKLTDDTTIAGVNTSGRALLQTIQQGAAAVSYGRQDPRGSASVSQRPARLVRSAPRWTTLESRVSISKTATVPTLP